MVGGESEATSVRAISCLFWAVWAYLALAVGIPTGGATWVLREHVAVVACLGVLVTTLCAAWALVLLARSSQHTQSPLVRGVTLFLASVFIAVGGLVSMWVIVEQARRPSAIDVVAHLASDAARWGWRFGCYQAIVTILSAGCVLLVGFCILRLWRAIARRRNAFAQKVLVSRLRLVTVAVMSIVALPALLWGGFEGSRRMGMKVFVIAHENYLGSLAKNARREWSRSLELYAKGQWYSATDIHVLSSGPVAWTDLCIGEERIVMACVSGGSGEAAPGSKYRWKPDRCRRALILPLNETERSRIREIDEAKGYTRVLSDMPSTLRVYGETFRNYRVRSIHGQWQEQGPTLTFKFPW